MKTRGLLGSAFGIKSREEGKKKAKLVVGKLNCHAIFLNTSGNTTGVQKMGCLYRAVWVEEIIQGLPAGSTLSNCGNKVFIPKGRITVQRMSTSRTYSLCNFSKEVKVLLCTTLSSHDWMVNNEPGEQVLKEHCLFFWMCYSK